MVSRNSDSPFIGAVFRTVRVEIPNINDPLAFHLLNVHLLRNLHKCRLQNRRLPLD